MLPVGAARATVLENSSNQIDKFNPVSLGQDTTGIYSKLYSRPVAAKDSCQYKSVDLNPQLIPPDRTLTDLYHPRGKRSYPIEPLTDLGTGFDPIDCRQSRAA